MKVNIKDSALVRFEEIEPSECFQWRGNYYMKTRTSDVLTNNAVNLHSGCLTSMDLQEEVLPYYNTEVTLR
jgi:hypothetical protein